MTFKERLKIALLVFSICTAILWGLTNGLLLIFSVSHIFWNLLDKIAFMLASIFIYGGIGALAGIVFSILSLVLSFRTKEVGKNHLISLCISIFIAGSAGLLVIMREIPSSITSLQLGRSLKIISLMSVCAITLSIVLYHVLKKIKNIHLFLHFFVELFKKKAFVIGATLLLTFSILNFFINEVFYSPKLHSSKKANIILISLDTLAARHMGCYGYFRNTTPSIDRFSQESVLFENAFSQSSWTTPSHMSILTSVYPSVHGVISIEYVLDDSFLTLAEVLKQHGYYSGAFVDGSRNGLVGSNHGFSQGFDFYEHFPERFNKYEKLYIISHFTNFIHYFFYPRSHSEKISREVLSWLKHYDKEQPFFLFLHYYDIHSDYQYKLPYVSPPPFDKMYYPDYKGDFTGCGNEGVCSTMYLRKINKKSRLGTMDETITSEDDIKYIASLYDNGINYVDKCIGLLLKGLNRLKLTNNTILILTADHGEEFMEHNQFLHEQYYDETIHVPLIVRYPEALPQNKRVKPLVRLIDIVPTVLDLIDVPIDKQFQGVSLLPYIFEKDSQEPLVCFGGQDQPSNEETLYVRSDSFKLIYNDLDRAGWAINRCEKKQLYNLILDTHEQNNLIGTEAHFEQKLQASLIKWADMCNKLKKTITPSKTIKKFEVDEKTKKQLKALGYIE